MAQSDDIISEVVSRLLSDKADCGEKSDLVRLIVQSGNLQNMYWVLSAGAEMIISPRNMNLRDKALLLAAEDGQLEVLQYLINEGGNVNVQDFDRGRFRTRDSVDACRQW